MGSSIVTMVKDKECKWSVRYALPKGTEVDQQGGVPAIDNAYVSRAALPRPVPDEITVGVSWEAPERERS